MWEYSDKDVCGKDNYLCPICISKIKIKEELKEKKEDE